jgi:hypothetical protein
MQNREIGSLQAKGGTGQRGIFIDAPERAIEILTGCVDLCPIKCILVRD